MIDLFKKRIAKQYIEDGWTVTLYYDWLTDLCVILIFVIAIISIYLFFA